MAKMRTFRKSIYYIGFVVLLSFYYACGAGDISSPSSSGGSDVGKSGSLARFTINNDKLYTLSGQYLKSYQISPNGNLTLSSNTVVLNDAIETIFSRGNALFVGTSSGMFIYEINTNDEPRYKTFYNHVYSCDPVVADDKYAYLTLNNSTTWSCRRGVNSLEIINVENLTSPTLEATYSMTSPKGLGIDSNLLFVCDDFLKVYDKTKVDSLKLIFTSDVRGNDVIPFDNKLILTSDAGFYQYQYSNNSLTLLSTILIGQ